MVLGLGFVRMCRDRCLTASHVLRYLLAGLQQHFRWVEDKGMPATGRRTFYDEMKADRFTWGDIMTLPAMARRGLSL
jgi:hypothetical protein